MARRIEPLLQNRSAPPADASAARRNGQDRPEDVIGITIDWLFESPLVRLNRWRCREAASGITGERQQFWRVIGFVHSGAYELRSPRGTALIDPLKVAFLNPLEPYQTSHPCGCGDHGSSLIVRDDVLSEILADHRPDLAEIPAGSFPLPSGPCPTRAFLLHRSLLQKLQGGVEIDPVLVEETALRVAGKVVRAAFPRRWRRRLAPARPARRELAEEARRILVREFRRPLHLADLAPEVGATPYHLCRIFREETGLPIHRYLTILRLRAAVEALTRGEKDLSGLAFDLGFSSHSHFTFAFRREFGLPPSRFRPSRSDLRRARI
jgi:AraC family transcriptional regulator